MQETEVWKDIAGYEGKYQVSNFGNVKSLNFNRTGKERILIPVKNNSGYLYVTLSKNCITKKFLTHRLTAEAYISNPNKLPCVNHIDENKLNNRVDNLEWCSYEYNVNFGTGIERMLKTRKLRNSKTAERQVLQFTKDGKFIKEYISQSDAARQTGINYSTISSCCKERLNTAGGYIWKYK